MIKINKTNYKSKKDVSYIVIYWNKNRWEHEILNSLTEAKKYFERNSKNQNGFIMKTSQIYNPVRK